MLEQFDSAFIHLKLTYGLSYQVSNIISLVSDLSVLKNSKKEYLESIAIGVVSMDFVSILTVSPGASLSMTSFVAYEIIVQSRYRNIPEGQLQHK